MGNSPTLGGVDLRKLTSLPALSDDMSRVDTALKAAATSTEPFLTDVASHLILAGGKRLRPALTVAAAMAIEPGDVDEDVIQAAVAVELVHIGSLYHDDVLDEATQRRTVNSVNAQYSNVVAVLGGDYLLARASSIAASLGTDIAGVLADTIAELCAGQVIEFRDNFDLDRSIDAYEKSIAGKTASLLATAARMGAMAIKAPIEQAKALNDFGHAFGMAFQIRDDVLDIIWTDEQLGKPAGNDLFEGVYTLPVIHAFNGEYGEELRSLLGKPIDTPTRDKARDLIRASDGIAISAAASREWAERASQALSPLPDSEVKAMMVELAENLASDVAAHA